MPDTERFEMARFRVLGEENRKEGIGTLGERALHKILKLYFEPDTECHEKDVSGSVADILNSEGIIEIQTRSLIKLRPKLDKFLPLYPVTVVLPIDAEKYISYIDAETGEISAKRKGNKKATAFDSVYEIYNIRDYIARPGFSIKIVLLTSDEYKIKGEMAFGKKRRSVRKERIPRALNGIITLRTVEDYRALIPVSLGSPFTRKEYEAAVGKKFHFGFSAIKILQAAGAVTECGKRGRENLYKIII